MSVGLNYNSWSCLHSYVKGEESTDLQFGPVVPVFGAGIHNLIFPSDPLIYYCRNSLASWNGIFTDITENIEECKLNLEIFNPLSPTLKWEMAALETSEDNSEGKDWTARKKEAKLRKDFCDNLRSKEARLLSKRKMDYKLVNDLVVTGHFSDIISLNLDLLLERSLSANYGLKFKVVEKGKNSRFRISKATDCIHEKRIWHPHGDREKIQSMKLGLWSYQNATSELKEEFGKIKGKESRNEGVEIANRFDAPHSWLELFMFRPLLFVGTSLNLAEWDLWYALLCRWRNYGKMENKKYEPPIWRLTTTEEIVKGQLDHLPRNKFQLLEAPEWQTGWDWLLDVFSGTKVIGNSHA